MKEIGRRSGFPLSAMLELTRRCNLRCQHCYQDLDGHGGPDFSTVVRWLDELAGAGVLFLSFTGGEVTLRPDWLDIAREARQRSFSLTIKTNGLAIDDAQADELAELSLQSVDISLYAARAKEHDAITRVPGSWERVIETIRRLRARDIPLAASIPAMTLNADQLRPAAELAEALGCRGLLMAPRIHAPLDAQRDTESLSADEKGMCEAHDLLLDHGFAMVDPSSAAEKANRPAWPCLIEPGGLYVRADGELKLCPTMPISFGNVLERSIPETWRSSPERQALEERAREPLKVCQSCDNVWACARCPARALSEHGELDRPGSLDCRFASARARQVLTILGERNDVDSDDVPEPRAQDGVDVGR